MTRILDAVASGICNVIWSVPSPPKIYFSNLIHRELIPLKDACFRRFTQIMIQFSTFNYTALSFYNFFSSGIYFFRAIVLSITYKPVIIRSQWTLTAYPFQLRRCSTGVQLCLLRLQLEHPQRRTTKHQTNKKKLSTGSRAKRWTNKETAK